MANKRLKGQETFVNIIQDGRVVQTFKAIGDWSFTDEMEVLDEGYIGETTNRKDSIYNGTGFNLSAHFEDASEDDLRQALVNKAKRAPGAATRVDMGFTLSFPNGQTRLVTLLDCEFGNIEINTGGRGEYSTGSFEGACSETLTLNL